MVERWLLPLRDRSDAGHPVPVQGVPRSAGWNSVPLWKIPEGVGMRKRVNPRRKPASQADIRMAKKEATEAAVKLAWSILFTVLRDKEGFELEDLRRVWDEVDDLSDSIAQGYCTVADLRDVLKQEIGANID